MIKQNGRNQLHNTRCVRVAHIASGDLWAGAEMQLFTLAVQLQQLPTIELHICLLNHGQLYKRLTNAGVAVSIFSESELGTIVIGKELYRVLRQFKPDVVHTHRLKENILGSVVALLLGNTPSIRTVHGAAEHYHGFLKPHKRLQSYIDYLCGRFLQKLIIAVSKDLAEQLGRTFPIKKVTTILNGIDRHAIASRAAEPVDFNFVKQAEVNICFAGRLAPVKRLDLWLTTAAILLRDSGHHFSFYVIGDGPERDNLTKLADSLHLAGRLQFLGEQENVPALLSQMDILLLTSDHEGLPMVILEALSLKTLVVAHNVGGIKAVLDEGRCGYLVNRHEGIGYAEQVLRSLQEPDEVIKKKEHGFLRANSTYSAKQSAKNYVAKYMELLNSQNKIHSPTL